MITIKKYPNRRLYDTSQSQYINLETIRELVMQHKEFRVVDSKTEDDLTKSILLQIISEQEGNDNQALLTQTVLKQLIRFYGSDTQGYMRQYLEQSIGFFLEQQDTAQDVMKDLIDATPMGQFAQYMEKNMSMWNAFGGPGRRPEGGAGTAPGPDDEPSDDEKPGS